MFAFFSDRLNVGYWLEKCAAWDRRSNPNGVVTLDAVSRAVDNYWLHKSILRDMEPYDGTDDVQEALEILHYWDQDQVEAHDIVEEDWQALLALCAIKWTIPKYRFAIVPDDH